MKRKLVSYFQTLEAHDINFETLLWRHVIELSMTKNWCNIINLCWRFHIAFRFSAIRKDCVTKPDTWCYDAINKKASCAQIYYATLAFMHCNIFWQYVSYFQNQTMTLFDSDFLGELIILKTAIISFIWHCFA